MNNQKISISGFKKNCESYFFKLYYLILTSENGSLKYFEDMIFSL